MKDMEFLKLVNGLFWKHREMTKTTPMDKVLDRMVLDFERLNLRTDGLYEDRLMNVNLKCGMKFIMKMYD